MTNRPKQTGTAHETAIVNWFREQGWEEADRLTMKGAADRGDVGLGFHVPVVIEAKGVKRSTQRVDMSGFMRELESEIDNAKAETGVVIIKKSGTTDVGKYYALLPVWRYEQLIAALYPKRRVIRRRRMT